MWKKPIPGAEKPDDVGAASGKTVKYQVQAHTKSVDYGVTTEGYVHILSPICLKVFGLSWPLVEVLFIPCDEARITWGLP